MLGAFWKYQALVELGDVVWEWKSPHISNLAKSINIAEVWCIENATLGGIYRISNFPLDHVVALRSEQLSVCPLIPAASCVLWRRLGTESIASNCARHVLCACRPRLSHVVAWK